MPDIWYYEVKGQQIGPITLQQLKQRLPDFPNAEEVLIWHASFTDWLPADDVAALIAEGRFDNALV
jgi:GYF domain 2